MAAVDFISARPYLFLFILGALFLASSPPPKRNLDRAAKAAAARAMVLEAMDLGEAAASGGWAVACMTSSTHDAAALD